MIVELVAIFLTRAIAEFLSVLARGAPYRVASVDFVRLPLDIANGANWINISMQNLVAANHFQRSGMKNVIGWRLKLGLVTAVKAFVGTQIVVGLEREFLEKVVGSFLLITVVLLDQQQGSCKLWSLSRNENTMCAKL